MHAYVFIYTLVPGIRALALDILAVAPFWLKRQRLTAVAAQQWNICPEMEYLPRSSAKKWGNVLPAL